MNFRKWVVGVVLAGTAVALAVTPVPSNADQYLPRLGDIMNLVQVRHAKLWFAGQAKNWDLAAYELAQLKQSLADAAGFYSGLPVDNVTTLSQPIQSISDAIAAKDGKRFASAVTELTSGCNACHATMQRGFVAIRIPTDKPFGNQDFRPQGH
ncbi:hypothetical protein SSBR45G_00390 [Bradyrhizobium sp. SSBR45G]|uniref:hypothetical protein n=1 Tax=unclassified Bradyrhizobium TaxID=2631580 RepID=UPI002342B0F1|nr:MULTISPECIES: hypothetical protein [unclassified Bradyrhizobium]GLH75131.1 hypothetical protein SSBR45G_00390 [Bradyrhizobium sp. SSBR45G]GLH83082.1 hypothetical protein SSBR45R_05420 [Bradyrhizobium sp. SSBR45R]